MPGSFLRDYRHGGLGVLDCSDKRNANAPQGITLGDSTLALNGPWKFHTGDCLGRIDPNFIFHRLNFSIEESAKVVPLWRGRPQQPVNVLWVPRCGDDYGSATWLLALAAMSIGVCSANSLPLSHVDA